MGKKYRVGIDVGGTFTDAVILDNETYEIVGQKKIPTTHEDGVAKGVITILNSLLSENNIKAEDVTFIAHGTTQATNALLEGDVPKVGIIGVSTGIDARSAKSESNTGDIELAQNKFLQTSHTFIDSKVLSNETIDEAINTLEADGAKVIVATETYSVENPTNELKIAKRATDKGLYATCGHEISQLYGLKLRTRTSVINASLIPKMIETATMTDGAVKDANIDSTLMIMRCDGGVMSIDEMKKRPILTMLSGLAAGVAGALMYEKISDGIFYEVGGTSIDISVIKNGKVMVNYAQVGGFKTYLRSLDVRTLAVAGGSMIRVSGGKIVDVGPRSAHIAHKKYECFDGAEVINGKLEYISPRDDDPAEYAVITGDNGKSVALTLCGASNILGYIADGDYAKGDVESAKKMWQILADSLGRSVEELAREAMEVAMAKLKAVVDVMIEEYELDKNLLTFVGGGGSASVTTQPLAEKYGCKFKIAKNAPCISTIGVTLAMVREQIEKTVLNPTEKDLLEIREEVIEKIVKSGANIETVEVTIEIDNQKNILRAIATGATELRQKDLADSEVTEEAKAEIVASALNAQVDEVKLAYQNGRWSAYTCTTTKKYLKFFKKTTQAVCLIDREGVVRFKNSDAKIMRFRKKNQHTEFAAFLHDNTTFSDANATIPKVFMFYKEKMLDLSGMSDADQLHSIFTAETMGLNDEDLLIAVAYK